MAPSPLEPQPPRAMHPSAQNRPFRISRQTHPSPDTPSIRPQASRTPLNYRSNLTLTGSWKDGSSGPFFYPALSPGAEPFGKPFALSPIRGWLLSSRLGQASKEVPGGSFHGAPSQRSPPSRCSSGSIDRLDRPPVDREAAPRDPSGSFGGQKQDERCNIIRVSHTAERNARRGFVNKAPRRLLEGKSVTSCPRDRLAFPGGRPDRPRGNGIDLDILPGKFEGEVFGQRKDCALGHTVVGETWTDLAAGHGSDIDDPSPLAALH